jgi:hypothetical protein
MLSAVDGFNIPLTDGMGTTLSNSIILHISVGDFFGEGGDGPEFRPVSHTVQSAGKHTFRMDIAYASIGQSYTDEFTWTVLPPVQGIQELVQTIDDLGLTQDVSDDLKHPLQQVTEV